MTTTNLHPPTVAVDTIDVGDNVRRHLGGIDELARSIERHGLLNPLSVRSGDDPHTVELVAGHRRLAAVRKLGWNTVPVVWVAGFNGADPDRVAGERIAVQLVENLQREDLGPMEEARGLAQLVELVGSQKAAAEAIGKSTAHVSKRLTLLKLSEPALRLVDVMPIEDIVDLAKLDEKTQRKIAGKVEGDVHPRTVRAHIDSAQRDIGRAAQNRKAAAAAAKRRENRKVEVVAVDDVKTTWKALEGWNGLAVDYDAHARESCHRLAVGLFNSWDNEPSEVAYCTMPSSHEPDGESKVKVATDTRAAEEAERDRRNAERAAELAENRARWEAVAVEKAEALDRNTALKVLSHYLIGQLDPEVRDLTLRAVGVDVPEPPTVHRYDGTDESRQAWDDHDDAITAVLDGLSIAQAYRAASLYALSVSAASADQWARQKRSANRIAVLVGIEPDVSEEEE
jgi:ParB/RepB/Spo0J family partition protein